MDSRGRRSEEVFARSQLSIAFEGQTSLNANSALNSCENIMPPPSHAFAGSALSFQQAARHRE